MRFSYLDTSEVTETAVAAAAKKLKKYRTKLSTIISKRNSNQPEYSLIHAADPNLHDTVDELVKKYKNIKHLVVIGIGGSSLGVEAVHTALGEKKVKLSVLDTIAPYEIEILLKTLEQHKKVSDVVVCVISKSGGTSETLVNGAILLKGLQEKFGDSIYDQTVFIGNPGTDMQAYAKRAKATFIAMPEKVGGRFSVATEVGIIPLALLGHDTDSFIMGLLDANSDEFEASVAESAARVSTYIQKGYVHYNFFAFDKRLAQLGTWYRQLFAESLGKEKTRNKKPLAKVMVPTISTAVELHSTGQLYLSGTKGVYTDFVTFDDADNDFKVPKTGLAKSFGAFTAQEVAVGIYAGVLAAYQERDLPYRSTIFDDDNLSYSLGLFMALRMRETMYIAELLDVNAFNQPNVELYKKKTKQVLGL